MKVIVMEHMGKKCVAHLGKHPYVEVLDWVMEIMKEDESFDKITIYTKEMTQEEVDSLPEFEGY
jgi:hypothetical protein